MKKNELAIKLVGVSKIYKLRLEKPTLIENIFRKKNNEKFVALNGIDIEIKKGERVGIVGANGSGKTTLLKVVSGITMPNKGKVVVYGKVVSLIDLSAGFHPELTGMENIYQNAMLLGMDRRETDRKMEEIVGFADIDGFVDAPMFTYSEGMKLRLGFSVAVATNPDVLILDEGIAVGDENFKKKSINKIDEFIKKGKTILVASHWMDYLRENCKRIIWLDKGRLKMDGGAEVLDRYLEQV